MMTPNLDTKTKYAKTRLIAIYVPPAWKGPRQNEFQA